MLVLVFILQISWCGVYSVCIKDSRGIGRRFYFHPLLLTREGYFPESWVSELFS